MKDSARVAWVSARYVRTKGQSIRARQFGDKFRDLFVVNNDKYGVFKTQED